MTQLSAVDGLSAADVMNEHVSTVPSSTTVGELRAYFAVSTSRRLAVLVDGERYMGAIPASGVPDAADAASPALDYATLEPTIDPSAPAEVARDLALRQPTLRLPVVDEGRLVGIVAINARRDAFCGT
jgi:CBS domain-containing protein